MFAGALNFDEILRILHHHVHVDVGGGVFNVAEVAERVPVDDAYGDGGDAVLQDLLFDAEACLDFLQGDGEGDETADDACGARAAVRFNYVAVDDDCVFAEGSEVGCSAEGTAHEALNFLGAAACAFAFAFHALARALREEAVFGGNPAGAAPGEPVGDFRQKCCVADDAGASHFNKDGAVGATDKAGGHLEVSEFFGFSVGSCVHRRLLVVSGWWLFLIINYEL